MATYLTNINKFKSYKNKLLSERSVLSTSSQGAHPCPGEKGRLWHCPPEPDAAHRPPAGTRGPEAGEEDGVGRREGGQSGRTRQALSVPRASTAVETPRPLVPWTMVLCHKLQGSQHEEDAAHPS